MITREVNTYNRSSNKHLLNTVFAISYPHPHTLYDNCKKNIITSVTLKVRRNKLKEASTRSVCAGIYRLVCRGINLRVTAVVK